MRSTTILLLLLSAFVFNAAPRVGGTSVAQECPSISVEAVDERDTKRAFTFKANVSRHNTQSELTYNWKVDGGEIKEGQGTTTLTVINYQMPKTSLTVVVEINGLPKDCWNKASISIPH